MSNTQIIPFAFGSHAVRSMMLDGEPWFVARDIAELLGYADPVNATKQHCRGVVKRHPIVDGLGRSQEARIIAEPDVWRLIVRSKLPEAQAIEAWLFEEVLPSLRRSGRYDVYADKDLPLPMTLHFGSVPLTPVFHQGKPYLTAADLSLALGYNRTDAISRTYRRHAADFAPEMSKVIQMMCMDKDGVERLHNVRIFSASGCHMLAMFVKSKHAAEFRRWALDVLEPHQQHTPPSPAQAVYQLSPAELMEYIGHALAKAGLGAAPSDAVPARELVDTQRQLIDAQRQLLASKPHGRKAGAQAGKPVSPGEAAHMRRLRNEGLSIREVAQRLNRSESSVLVHTRETNDTGDLFGGDA